MHQHARINHSRDLAVVIEGRWDREKGMRALTRPPLPLPALHCRSRSLDAFARNDLFKRRYMPIDTVYSTQMHVSLGATSADD